MHLAAHIAALIAVLSTGVVYGTGAALALLVGCVLLYLRLSAPINRALTAAADKHETPANAPHCNAIGTASSCPGPSCRAWQSPRCA
jgi:hypothetical protein